MQASSDQQVGCAYCGSFVDGITKDHVFPKCLFPSEPASSRTQRITLPCCVACNRDISLDEEHFCKVLLCAGSPNDAVMDRWKSKALRSFDRGSHGMRQAKDLLDMMRPVTVDDRERHLIYPAKEERVLRVLRKIIRGLSHHFDVETAVPESRVWVDVLRPQIPDGLLDACGFQHRHAGVYECFGHAFGAEEPELTSLWLMLFYDRTPFVGLVSRCGVPTLVP